jgi:hypothetical protein
LPLKTLVLYIYRPRGTMQYNQQLYAFYSYAFVTISVNYLQEYKKNLRDSLGFCEDLHMSDLEN